ncbi:MAG: AAA family ATPase [Candidatus Omnitrophota bacterium]
MKGQRSVFINTIKRSYGALRKKHDFIVVEGTGHAGVGSVIDMSNADVAALLRTKVVIVTHGGVGRSIDEIMLNFASFRAKKVEVLGVIINKVRKDKYEKVDHLVRKALRKKNIRVLGVIPFEEALSSPTVGELLEDLDGRLICGRSGLNKVVERFVIGDMVNYEASNYFSEGTLLIILDVVMDTMCDGIDLARKLKNDKKFQSIPILMLSAIKSKTGFDPSGACDSGWVPVEEYAEKPLTPELLIEKVEKLLKGR